MPVKGEVLDTERVDIAEFAPAMLPFLGLSAYLQLELYGAATKAVAGAPSLRAKNVLARVAGQALAKYKKLSDELVARGHEPHVFMQPYAGVVDAYVQRVATSDWHQHVLSIYLVGGLFDDFFAQLACGVRDDFAGEVKRILGRKSGRGRLRVLLAEEVAKDVRLSGWLALWGRRLVGDTLLVAREVLVLSENRRFVESEVEPMFQGLIADHSRRMEALGLTA